MNGITLSTMSSATTPGERPAPDALQRGHEDARDAEAVEEGLQRDREADRRAVGEREHEPLPAAAAALLREEREVRGHVHARERNRRVGLVAERGPPC